MWRIRFSEGKYWAQEWKKVNDPIERYQKKLQHSNILTYTLFIYYPVRNQVKSYWQSCDSNLYLMMVSLNWSLAYRICLARFSRANALSSPKVSLGDQRNWVSCLLYTGERWLIGLSEYALRGASALQFGPSPDQFFDLLRSRIQTRQSADTE